MPGLKVATKRSQINPSLKQGVSLVQTGYATFLFSALSRENWAESVTTGMGQFFSFPAFVGLNVVKTGFYLHDLATARNRNIGKVASLTRELIGLGIVSVAVVGGFLTSTVLSVLSPLLFVAGMAFNTLYHFGAAFYSGYRFLTATNPHVRQQHKANFIKNITGALLGAVTTIGVTFLMVLKIAPAAMAIVNAVVNGVGFGMGVIGAIKTRKKALNSNSSPVAPLNISLPPEDVSDYFYEKNRSAQLSRVPDPKAYLKQEIEKKISALEEKQNPTLPWWNRLFIPHKNIETKIAGLKSLKGRVERQDVEQSADGSNQRSASAETYPTLANPTSGLFQSFFRKKSDTQDIFEAASIYLKEDRVAP